MALRYKLNSVDQPSSRGTISLIGDGSSKAINIPLTMAPLNFPFGLGLHNPALVQPVGVGAGFTANAALTGTFKETLALTNVQDPNNGNAALGNGAEVDISFVLVYDGT